MHKNLSLFILAYLAVLFAAPASILARESLAKEYATPQEVIDFLNLSPLPGEGGFYRQTYLATGFIPPQYLPPGSPQIDTPYSSAIYFLLRGPPYNDKSAFHVLTMDEVWHHYLGGTITMVNIFPDGTVKLIKIGKRIFEGEVPQYVVPAGVWQASFVSCGEFVLVGTTNAPAFESETLYNSTTLVSMFPQAADWINKLAYNV